LLRERLRRRRRRGRMARPSEEKLLRRDTHDVRDDECERVYAAFIGQRYTCM
jgi:hypothetical protein